MTESPVIAVQPLRHRRAAAAGELTGILVAKAYHEYNGEAEQPDARKSRFSRTFSGDDKPHARDNPIHSTRRRVHRRQPTADTNRN
ncbi:hypothetical protein C8039_02280 [Halogeometricum sp. wsp3]|nr:hypothetical protein C8039_02280 [Halogeometricum sp. wsp3]